ncbi:peptide/nickel transport system substrate-binding protein/oligopeptide transport system substrate-binding protein [Micromonospora phaseoli]|uniref:Peptide/nickel transport system substrate-binding protein/oligopeptide transport system substrate-binding protein n=1 Tax=Micromonospora phaseoli TaxID=1144548 RepID=A0A1H6X2V4_9ACTN|nr:ABC transporter substrate-binding protein [Micromonospora phaseoli]PZW01967.1 peptide/nickel transport system substrate-binding protein/oligopeptide transport system substrate-binding protein [Micromonospora phaseoli]GIJ80899.1 ABC transporter substrate-binding protein [Micromonospora phaseoli]SEJ20897.1 peptide/nickel transport system substrate-binding protein/oligopeptide transport system substrate-binding protein [Micromonospora phaseoli]
MRVRRLAAWTALPLAVTLGLAACGSGGDGGSGESDPNAAVRIEIAEPQHLVPTNTNETSGSQVLAALFSPLVDYDEAHKPYEVAAESITSEDNTTWTIKLKDGYTFHNGEDVTADSYIDAWNYGAYAPNGQNSSYFFEKIAGYDDLQGESPKAETLSGLKKVDDQTFAVTLSQPYSEFKAMLGYTAFYPLPEAAFSAPGELAEGFEQAPIGQGPFKMKGTWQHDAKVEVERYDAFPGERPKVAGVEFRIYQQLTAAYADVLSDNLDVIKTIPTENLSTAETDLGDRFLQSPASSLHFLAFPTFQEEFSNPDVRKAISMAIDRDEITTSIFKDSQQPARSFVSPAVAGYRENTVGAPGEFDPAKAKALYQAAGGPSKITLSYNGDGGHKDWIDATCNQLKANLGVDCVGNAEPKFADLLTKVKAKQPVGLFRMGWIMDYPSMENYLGPLYSTNGSSNYYGYSNPDFDRLLAEGASAPSEEEAIKKYQEAEDLLAEDLPVVPLRFGQNNFGHSTKVQNVEMDLFDRIDLIKIEAVK